MKQSSFPVYPDVFLTGREDDYIRTVSSLVAECNDRKSERFKFTEVKLLSRNKNTSR